MTKYNLHLFYENGEGYKIIGIKEGLDVMDYISKKYDRLLDSNRGSIEVSDHDDLRPYIMVNDYYDLTWEEKQTWEEDE